MNTASVMDQIIDTLTFEVEAIPQDKDDIYKTPLKVKIKLRKNDKIKKLLQSVTAVPKMGHAKDVSDKIQTNSSEQTLTSFEILMADDETKKKPQRKQKRVLYLFKKAGCLGTHIEDEDYVYSRGTSKEANENEFEPNISTSTNSYEKRNFTLVKNYSNYEGPHLTKGTHKDFLGKCKPGGCLDPPFSEDKYMYIPKIIETKRSDENHVEMCKNDVESIKSFTKNDSVSESRRPPSSLIKISSMNVKKSNSIITYPSMSSTELNIKDNDKKNVKEKQNSKDYTVSNNSSLKFIDKYYVSPKTIKLNKAKEEDSSLLDQNTIKRSFGITPVQVENSVHGQKIETLKLENGTIHSESSLPREIREKSETLSGKYFVPNSETTGPKFFTENYKTNYLNEGEYGKAIDLNSKNTEQTNGRDEIYSSEWQILSPIKKNASVITTLESNDLENTKKATEDPYPSESFITVMSEDNKVKNNINDNINVQGNPELFDENNVVIDKLATSNIMNTTNSLQQLTGENGENYFLTTSENEIARPTNNNLLPKQTIDGIVPQEISTNMSSNHIPYDYDIDFKNQKNETSQQFHEKQVIEDKSITNMLTGSETNLISSFQPKNEREIFFIKEAVQYLPKVEENEDKTNDVLKGSKSIENTSQLKKSVEIGHPKFDDTSILTDGTRENNLRDNTDYFDIDLPSNKIVNMESVSQYTINKDEDFKKIKLIKDNFLTENLNNAPGISDTLFQNTSESILHDSSAERSSPTTKNLEQEDKLSNSLIPSSVNINKGIDATESNDSHSHSFEENIQPSGKLLIENVTTAKENKDSNTGYLPDYNHEQIQSQTQDFENDNNSTEIISNIKKKSTNELNTSMETKFKPTRDSVEQNNNKIRSVSDTTLIDLYDISYNKDTINKDERILNLKENQKEDLFHFNIAIQSLLNFENETIIKTLNTSSGSENSRYLSQNIQKLNTIMRPGDSPVILPIDKNNNLSLQVVKAVTKTNRNQAKTTKTPLTGDRLQKFDEDGIALTTKSYFDNNKHNMKKYVGDRNKSCGNLQQALDSVYDKNLVPLHKIIKNLRDDVDGLAKKKTLVQNALNKNLENTSKSASKHCGCVQFLF